MNFFSTMIEDYKKSIVLFLALLPIIFVLRGYFKTRNKLLKDWLPLSIVFLLFLDLTYSARRMLELYYIIFAMISANVFSTKYKQLIIVFILIYGASIMTYEFYRFLDTFTISHQEIKEFDSAIQFLNSSKIVNVDPVCSWFFPLKNKDLLIPGPYMYVSYDTRLLYRIGDIAHGEYVDFHLPTCVSRYSFDDSKVPFKETFELKNISINKNYLLVYNGSLINILY